MLNKLKRVNVVNLIVSIVFLGCWYFLYANVRLAADDHLYIAFSENVIPSVWNYYLVGNGRLVINLIESFLMKFDRYALIIINPLIMIVLAFLIHKLADMLTGKRNKYTYTLVLASIAAMDVMLAQEAHYWLSGSVTYLFSAVMFVATLIIFIYIKANPDISTKRKVGLVILCVLFTFSMEQFALMTAGFIFFAVVYELISTKKIKKLHLLLLGLCALAALSGILAPANFVRLDDNSAVDAGFSASKLVSSMLDAVFFNYSSPSAMRFVAVISVLALILFIRNGKRLLTLVSGVELAVIVLYSFAKLEGFVLVALGLVVFFVLVIGALIVAANSKQTAVYTISLVVLAYMSQVFMLVDKLHHDRIYRISYTVIVVYIIIAVYLASKLDNIAAAILTVSVLIMFVNPYAGLVLLVASLILLAFSKSNKVNLPALCVVSVLGICLSLIPEAVKLIPYTRLTDYNEAQLRSGNKEIILYNVKEEDMEVIYYCNFNARGGDKNFAVGKGYYEDFCPDDFEGGVFRNYYGLTDDQVVRIEFIEGDVSDFLESVGY